MSKRFPSLAAVLLAHTVVLSEARGSPPKAARLI